MTAPIDLESLRGILKDEQQGAQMEGPLTDEELVSLSEHCCYPDGILDRVIAEHDAQPAPAPVQVGGLKGDARLAHDQCRAVVQMARALAEVHEARMSILATGRAPVEVIGQSSAETMEWLGDALTGMDACDESEEWMGPVFDAAQARWPG